MSLFSGSSWKWTFRFRFLLLGGAAIVVGVVSALLHVLFGEGSVAGVVFFFLAALCIYPLFMTGVVGAVVSYVIERRRHHEPPATPVT